MLQILKMRKHAPPKSLLLSLVTAHETRRFSCQRFSRLLLGLELAGDAKHLMLLLALASGVDTILALQPSGLDVEGGRKASRTIG